MCENCKSKDEELEEKFDKNNPENENGSCDCEHCDQKCH